MPQTRRQFARLRRFIATSILFALLAGLVVACHRDKRAADRRSGSGSPSATIETRERVRYVWSRTDQQDPPASDGRLQSNIEPVDYAGAESCRQCHADNFDQWSRHPHRWMNAEAVEENVRGDFSGVTMRYLGGVATFSRTGGRCYMTLERDGQKRVFQVDRTIGSRFFQYYVGRLIEGPEPADHPLRVRQNVLPLGYWIQPREWVPIVHVDFEYPDGKRDDPFGDRLAIYDYDQSCAACHTTLPAGNWMVWRTGVDRLRWYAPVNMTIFAADYLSRYATGYWRRVNDRPETAVGHIDELIVDPAFDFAGREHAIQLGISCEACHYGCREHVADPETLPRFLPHGKFVRSGGNGAHEGARTPSNLNWTCARCHSGSRPVYASGAHTWNSTEYSDAVGGGACYDPARAKHAGLAVMTCVHCHNPHQAIGQRWRRTPQQDDASCIQCHSRFSLPQSVAQHTHHAAGSEGSRCMNCHMPRINEGLQDMVRSHRISSPTEANLLENNQPNACNMCHVDRNIQWTLSTLREWYGTDAVNVSSQRLAKHYRDLEQAVGVGWLGSEHFPTRLVAVDSLVRQRAWWALDDIVRALDDPYLINRQFAQRQLEQALHVNLREQGYRFYMTPEERATVLPDVIRTLRQAVAGELARREGAADD